jgi:hypothetical protein
MSLEHPQVTRASACSNILPEIFVEGIDTNIVRRLSASREVDIHIIDADPFIKQF